MVRKRRHVRRATAGRATGGRRAKVAEAFTDRSTVHAEYATTADSETDGGVTVEAHPDEYGDTGETSTADSVTVRGDAVLVAAGRIPNSDTLDLDVTDVETDDRGLIKTDEYPRTTAEDMWALSVRSEGVRDDSTTDTPA